MAHKPDNHGHSPEPTTTTDEKGSWISKSWWMLLIIGLIITLVWVKPFGEIDFFSNWSKSTTFKSEFTLEGKGDTKTITLPSNLANISTDYDFKASEDVKIRQIGVRLGKNIDESFILYKKHEMVSNLCEGATLYITNLSKKDCDVKFIAYKK